MNWNEIRFRQSRDEVFFRKNRKSFKKDFSNFLLTQPIHQKLINVSCGFKVHALLIFYRLINQKSFTWRSRARLIHDLIAIISAFYLNVYGCPSGLGGFLGPRIWSYFFCAYCSRFRSHCRFPPVGWQTKIPHSCIWVKI